MRTQHPEWLRGPSRRIGEQIVLDRAAAERYQPASEWQLLFDLAAVRLPPDAIAFVSQYGLLRHGPYAAYKQESFSDWLEVAYTLTNLLDLYHLIQGTLHGDPAALATLRDEWTDRIRPLLQAAPTTNVELVAGASQALAALVSEGLRDAQVEVDSLMGLRVTGASNHSEPGTFALAPRFRDLVGLAYFALAVMLCLRTPLRMCAECGRHFAPRNRHQRFHDRACAARARRGPRRDDQQQPAPATQGPFDRPARRATSVPGLAFSLPRPSTLRPRRQPAVDHEPAGADSPR